MVGYARVLMPVLSENRSVYAIEDSWPSGSRLKIGEPVKVVYMRGTERHETQLTPSARK